MYPVHLQKKGEPLGQTGFSSNSLYGPGSDEASEFLNCQRVHTYVLEEVMGQMSGNACIMKLK